VVFGDRRRAKRFGKSKHQVQQHRRRHNNTKKNRNLNVDEIKQPSKKQRLCLLKKRIEFGVGEGEKNLQA
jgi:hypothetical protein